MWTTGVQGFDTLPYDQMDDIKTYKNQRNNLAEAWLFSCGYFLLPGSRDALLLWETEKSPETPGRRIRLICRKKGKPWLQGGAP